MDNLKGLVLKDRYEIESLVDPNEDSGEAYVWKAWDTELNRSVAVKVWKQPPEGWNEVQRLVDLSHAPRIADIYARGDYIDDDQDFDFRYMVIQYAAGGSLKQRLASQNKLKLDEAIPIFQQICEAVQSAHDKDIVHLDIKPANILFDEEGNVILVDFGIATLASQSQETLADQGTSGYKAPEVNDKERESDLKRADVYSLGIVLHEMLTGHGPPVGYDIQEDGIKSELPERLIGVIETATNKNFKKRYATVEQFKTAFEHALNPPVKPRPAWMPVGMGFGAAMIVVAVFVGIPLLAGLFTIAFPQKPNAATIYNPIIEFEANLSTRNRYEEEVVTGVDMPAALAVLYGQQQVLSAVGYITAGVDLADLEQDDITVEDNVITIQLPAPVIQDCFLSEPETRVISRRESVFAAPNAQLDHASRMYALETLLNAALEANLLTEAATKAEEQLIQLLQVDVLQESEAYEIIVQFDEPSAEFTLPDTCPQ